MCQSEVVEQVLDILFAKVPPETTLSQVRTRLQAGELAFPSTKTLSQAWIPKFDMLSMAWDQYTWGQEHVRVGTIGCDGTSIGGESWLCTVCDDFDFPLGMTCAEQVSHNWSEVFSRRFEILAQLGMGAGDRTHKALAVRHQCLLRTGGGDAMTKFRWSRMSAITDQGTERKLWDIPNISSIEDVTVVRDLVRSAKLQMDASKPEAFMWPRLIVWTGPLHIIYNALKTFVSASPGWEEHLEVLKAVVAVLGNRGAKRRWLALTKLSPQSRFAFNNFQHQIVDWKWEHMEKLFLDLDDLIENFFACLNVKAMKSSGGMEGEAQVLDQKALTHIASWQETPERISKFAAATSGWTCLFVSLGKIARWMKGCACHEHLLKPFTHLSQFQQEAALSTRIRKETNGKASACWAAGRRASGVARGEGVDQIKKLGSTTSELFNARLAKLGQQDRNSVLFGFTSTATKIQEELLEKFEYHQRIPHLICGIWPLDEKSQGIAMECIAQFDSTDPMHSHRVSFRMLSPTTSLGQQFRQAVVDQHWPARLHFELKAMNLASTTEQYLESVHSISKNFVRTPGRGLQLAKVCAKLRGKQTFATLNPWERQVFASEFWGNFRLARTLALLTGLPPGFCSMIHHVIVGGRGRSGRSGWMCCVGLGCVVGLCCEFIFF